MGAAKEPMRAEGGARMPISTRNALIFACITLGWVILDQITKAFFDAHEVGASIAEPLPGVLGFTLVRNTGGAWGAFGDMTIVLVVLSLAICAVILFYLFVAAPESSILMTVGLALVFAGGVGNLIDRITGGYVIDFIKTLFVEFPVFNIADIGVTCGIVIVMVALIRDSRAEKRGR